MCPQYVEKKRSKIQTADSTQNTGNDFFDRMYAEPQ